MESTYDVFGIWPDTGAMATAIGEKPDTVYRWRKKGRIPEDAWPAVIDAAKVRGHVLSADEILAFNAPMKKRGKPSHKVRPLRRRKHSVTSARLR